MSDPVITTVFFDLGGVVLSNGWDHQQRGLTAAHFELDADALEASHARLAESLECGEITMNDYLAQVLAQQGNKASTGELREYIFSLSQQKEETLALLRRWTSNGGLRWATLNNEGLELNEYRIERFALRRVFSAFCSSCYLATRKPGAEIFRRALGVLQDHPRNCAFVDDREENLAAPRALGIQTFHFQSAAQLAEQFRCAGIVE